MPTLRALSASNPLNNRIVDGLEFAAPFLQDAIFYARSGNADMVKQAREGTTQAAYFRALNANANTATPPTPSYPTLTKRIVSFDAKVDRVVQDRGEAVEDEIAYQCYLEAREAGWTLQEKFFEGDNAAESTEFDGLRTLVDVGETYEIGAGAGVVLQLGSGDDAVAAQQSAIEELQRLIKRVRGGATHLYMNDWLHARWITVAKHLGYYRQSKDELGNAIDEVAGVILRSAGTKKDHTQLLPFDESVTGGAANCSSIFAVRWGERSDLSALTTVGVSSSLPTLSGNFWIVNVNLDIALLLQDTTAVVQAKGWRLSAS